MGWEVFRLTTTSQCVQKADGQTSHITKCKGGRGSNRMLKRQVRTRVDFLQSLDLEMDLLLSRIDTRLRASIADGVVLVVCLRLHMPKMNVGQVRSAESEHYLLFPMLPNSNVSAGNPWTDNCRSDSQRPTENEQETYSCQYEQRFRTELLRPLIICRGKRRRSDGVWVSHELANTTVTTTTHPPLRHVNSWKREKLISLPSGGATGAGNIGRGDNGKLVSTRPTSGCLQQKKDTIVCVPPALKTWSLGAGEVCCASRYLRPPHRVAIGNCGRIDCRLPPVLYEGVQKQLRITPTRGTCITGKSACEIEPPLHF